MTMAIAHRLAMDYLGVCDDEKRNALIGALRDSVVELLQTADGVKVVCTMLGYGSSKDRKVIVRGFKSEFCCRRVFSKQNPNRASSYLAHVEELCCDVDGHLALVRALDAVDDTMLLKKVVSVSSASHFLFE